MQGRRPPVLLELQFRANAIERHPRPVIKFCGLGYGGRVVAVDGDLGREQHSEEHGVARARCGDNLIGEDHRPAQRNDSREKGFGVERLAIIGAKCHKPFVDGHVFYILRFQRCVPRETA